MTRTEIIELANQLSERKGEKTLNLQSIYRFVLQDIAKRERFWWRRKYFSFSLVTGQPTYDLTVVATTPANAMVDLAFDEITKLTVILAASPYQVAEFVPVFDPETLMDVVNGTRPASYLATEESFPAAVPAMDLNKTIRIDPPDMNYTAYILGSAMPNPASDSASDVVPLIPPWGHNAIAAIASTPKAEAILPRMVCHYGNGTRSGMTERLA